MTFVLGVTGGIASGKSLITGWFKADGVPVIDADVISHQLMRKGALGWLKVRDRFGPQYFLPNGELDRRKLGHLVFNDDTKMKILNEAVQEVIRQTIIRQIAKIDGSQEPLVVVDVPLLFEQHYEVLVDAVLVVDVDEQTQIQRLMQRDYLAEDDARRRIQAQMPLAQKRAKADFIITNTGTIKETRQAYQLFLAVELPRLLKE